MPFSFAVRNRFLGLSAATLFIANLVACQPQESESAAPSGKTSSTKKVEEAEVMHEDAESTLREEANQKEKFSESLILDLRNSNHYYGFGTAHSDIGIMEHQCYSLGLLLGKGKSVSHLHLGIIGDYHPITEINSTELHNYYASLENFTAIARSLLKLSEDERSIQWNLNCVGTLGISSAEAVASVKSRTFYSIVNDGYVLNVLGDIEDGFSQKVINAINENPSVGVVALGSGGGSVYEAIRAGRYIRGRGLTTALWSNCYSACPLVFMGGTTRMNWSPYPSLGFHQIYSKELGAIPFDSQPYIDVYRYISEMGVDADYVVQNMWAAAPHEMNTIDGKSDVLCERNIVTWVQRGCSSPFHTY